MIVEERQHQTRTIYGGDCQKKKSRGKKREVTVVGTLRITSRAHCAEGQNKGERECLPRRNETGEGDPWKE